MKMLYGLAVSVLGGAVVTWFMWWAIGKGLKIPPKPKGAFPPSLMGIVERTVFTLLVAYEFGDVLTAMMAWIGLKLAGAWQPRLEKADPKLQVAALRSIIVGLVSMLLSVIGGRIAKGECWWW